MIRLSNKDSKKLKRGQLLWYIEKNKNGVITVKTPVKFEHFYDNKTWGWAMSVYDYKVHDIVDYFFFIPKNNSRYSPYEISYFAKVTRREESEFITAIMIL